MQGPKRKDFAAKATNCNIESKTSIILELTAAAVDRTSIWKMDSTTAKSTEKISIMNVLQSMAPVTKLNQP